MIRFTTRDLVWLYFWLLIFEGALRKWFLPQLSAPLLIIRDPVVILAYFMALRAGIFPWNLWIASILGIGLGMLLVGMFVEESNLTVVLYGLRTDILHLPFIFLIARTFQKKDLQKMGSWIVKLIFPMAILMVIQFLSSPDSFINTTAGGEGTQIEGTYGNIRPPGVFSYITGAAEFLTLGCAFLIAFFMTKGVVKSPVLALATAGLCIALSVSISRLALSYVSIVFAMMFLFVFLRPHHLNRLVGVVIIGGVLFLLLLNLDFMQRGLRTFSERITNASMAEGGSQGYFSRVMSDYISPMELLWTTPSMGYGLGIGTSAGAHLLSGERVFLLAEGEWPRNILESGPVLGVLFIGWRVLLTAWLGIYSIRSALLGYAMPIFLFGACNQLLLVGQISRPTTLGFAVMGGGLCLSAIQAANRDYIEKRKSMD